MQTEKEMNNEIVIRKNGRLAQSENRVNTKKKCKFIP